MGGQARGAASNFSVGQEGGEGEAGWGADRLRVCVCVCGRRCSKCELQAESLGRRYLYVTEKGLTQAQGFDAPVSTSWSL